MNRSKPIKYSIVMSYYNRRKLLLNTLQTIQHSSKIDEVEVIITDDASVPKEKIFDFPKLFKFPINIIRVEPENKWYVNPCVPYNMAIRRAQGEVIILQNPEIIHTDDIITSISETISDDNYLAYGVLAADLEMTNQISKLNYGTPLVFDRLKDIVMPAMEMRINGRGTAGWYNHSVYRPSALHFLTAITKNNMDKLGGFNEKFAKGIDYDDSEFIFRVKEMGLHITFVDSPFGIHQNHPKISYNHSNLDVLRQHNKTLYFNIINGKQK